MSNEANGRFYWLKLKKDFFKRHDITIIESMPNGKDYVLFYLKIALESTSTGGIVTVQQMRNLYEYSVERILPVLVWHGLVEQISSDSFRIKDVNEKSIYSVGDYGSRNRNSEEYRKWRKAVFKRDNYTCQRCGKRGGRIEAHHIIRWVDDSSMRYAITNGITLCKECHIEEHRKRRNTNV